MTETKQTFEDQIASWGSEETLDNLKTLLVSLRATLEWDRNEDNLIVGYTIRFFNDEHQYKVGPVMFDWPLQELPFPEAFKNTGILN